MYKINVHSTKAHSILLFLEDDVTIGHQVILHSCHIKKDALIGMGSIILDGAEIGEGAYRCWKPRFTRKENPAEYISFRSSSESRS